MNCVHYLLRGLWPRDSQNTWVHLAHQIATALTRFCSQTPRHNHFAIFCKGFTNCVQAFFHGIVDKTAGIDNDQVGALESFGSLVTLCIELGQNQL